MNRGSEQAPAWRQAQPELSVSTRLLLLLSRIRLDDEQSQRALALCELIDDWEGFAERAAEFFIAPLCLHHLARLGEGPPMRQARAALRERAGSDVGIPMRPGVSSLNLATAVAALLYGA